MNQQPENPFARILSLLLLVAGAVIVSRFLLLLRPFVFVSLLVLGMLAWLGYRLYERRRERREAEAFATSVQGIIQRRLRECETGIAANSAEIQEITATVKELERELLELDGASEEKVRETRRLIEAFQAEKSYERPSWPSCKRRCSACISWSTTTGSRRPSSRNRNSSSACRKRTTKIWPISKSCVPISNTTGPIWKRSTNCRPA